MSSSSAGAPAAGPRRAESGDYVSAHEAALRFEVLPAQRGECFLIHGGDAERPALILIDGGPAGTYRSVLRPRLEALRRERDSEEPLDIDLVIISHSDDDHMRGILDLLEEIRDQRSAGETPLARVKALWFNSVERILDDDSGALASVRTDAEEDDLYDRDREALAANLVLAGMSGGQGLLALAQALEIRTSPVVGGPFIYTPNGERVQFQVGGIRLSVVGPLVEEIGQLQHKYHEWLSTRPKPVESGLDTLLDALSGSSMASASSIVVLAEQGGRSALITGNARSDLIVRGLEEFGLLGPGETMEVDILKVPHLSRDPSVDELIRRVHARTYVFSGDGKLAGPDPEVLRTIMRIREGADVRLCFAEPLAEIDSSLQERNERRSLKRAERGTGIAQSIQRVVAARSKSILAGFSDRKDSDALGVTGGAADLKSPHVMHAALGSEALTQPWVEMLELMQGQNGAPLPNGALRILGARTSLGDNLAWIDIAVAPGLGKSIWLALNAERWEGPPEAVSGSFAVLLPHDKAEPINVRLEVGFEPVPGFWQLAPRGLTARLAEPSSGWPAGMIWKPLWEAQRNALIFSNAEGARQLAASEQRFVNIVVHKRASPIAASIGAAILIRANLLDSLHDWPRNIANWFPELPDGPILWAETLLRRQRRKSTPPLLQGGGSPDRRDVRDWLSREDTSEALAMFLELGRRGPPVLGPTLAMAVRQAELWSIQKGAMAPATAERVTEIAAMIEGVAALAEPETLFASFRSAERRFLPPAAYRHRPA